MAVSSSESTPLPHSLANLIPIKLSSSNYLLWKSQIEPLLSLQGLISHIDSLVDSPTPTITTNDKTSPNPEYVSWLAADQRTMVLINATLSEEAMTVVVGLATARQRWQSLEAAYGNTSIERVQNLRDQLRTLLKGSKSVADFGRQSKGLSDQLAASGYPVNRDNQTHLFLCGLGPSFESFSAIIKSVQPPPSLQDLISKSESHEMFFRSLHAKNQPPFAFTAQVDRTNTPVRGRRSSRFAGSGNRGGRNGGRGYNRRLPHCQLCCQSGYYASACPSLSTFANRHNSVDDSIANAFLSKCVVNESRPDWFADSGATNHMTPNDQNVINTTPSSGSQNKTSSG
ncbi:putative RNA-directed DNA polymerase [Helianthus debilis subsp. tardiflorus]